MGTSTIGGQCSDDYCDFYDGGFLESGYPGTPKWDDSEWKSPLEMDDLGIRYTLEAYYGWDFLGRSQFRETYLNTVYPLVKLTLRLKSIAFSKYINYN